MRYTIEKDHLQNTYMILDSQRDGRPVASLSSLERAERILTALNKAQERKDAKGKNQNTYPDEADRP